MRVFNQQQHVALVLDYLGGFFLLSEDRSEYCCEVKHDSTVD